MVPLTIVRRRDLELDGSRPAIMGGYGGYGVVIPHFFAPTLLPWLERGGVFALAHVRGGEKGRAWYLAGQGANKANGIRDFIAYAEYLRAKRYTAPNRLAAHGVSMGGVLVGGAITERPDAFRAAIIEVGILNTVRFLQGVNGANQIAELGSPETEARFRSLLTMDPYHRIKDGVRYPAVLLSVGLNDHRVSSWHSGKFAARLAAASTSGNPLLMRIEADAGHGVGSTRDQEAALEQTYLHFCCSSSPIRTSNTVGSRARISFALLPQPLPDVAPTRIVLLGRNTKPCTSGWPGF